MRMFLVGGMVRDQLLNRPSKDADFAVEAKDFDAMVAALSSDGFKIFQARPEYGTVRAQFPEKDKRRSTFGNVKDVDFVLCRRDGFYTDGRRPESVAPGTLADDLARRDFTINAMALAEDGSLIDPHFGQVDIQQRVIRCVGDPQERIEEDFLRAVRAVRFAVTLGFTVGAALMAVLRSDTVVAGVEAIPHERRRDELTKMFTHGSLETIEALTSVSRDFAEASLTGLRLQPTTRQKL